MNSVSALRRFVRPRDAAERCDNCGAALPPVHIHQFEPAKRAVRCACDVCAVQSGNWTQIPREVRALSDFRITEIQWNDLMIPIGLAFFSYSTPAGRVLAFYPGPAGATESLMDLDTWREIAETNPELLLMKPDVEALLVNRVGASRQYFLVPVDECYRLVGLIRIHWRGLSGGAAVWGEIAAFFEHLRARELACRP
jgi:hypothetical protein